MTTLLRRGVVVSLVALLSCSLALGAAAPAVAAGSAVTGDGALLSDGLGLDEPVNETVRAVETVTGTGTETDDETRNGDGGGAPADGPTGDTVEETTDGVETVADATLATETPTPTPHPPTVTPTPTQTATPEPTAEPTPVHDPDETVVGEAVGDTARTVTGSATGNLTPDETTGPVEQIVDATTNPLNETENETGETVENTSRETDGTVRETVPTATGEAAGANESTGNGASVGAATEVVDVTVAETANGTTTVTTVVDGTVASTTRLVRDETGLAGGLVAGVVERVGKVSGGLTSALDGTVVTVQRTTDTLTNDADRTAATTGGIVDSVVASTVGGGLPIADGSGPAPAGSYGVATDGTVGPRESTSPAPVATPESASAGDANASDADGSAEEGAEGGSDITSAATSSGPLAAFDGVDPAAGDALLGSLLVAGSFLAARAGLAASATGAGATTLPQLLFAALREFALRLAVLAGYSRYDFDDPLENENRAAILETVESSPGINLTSLVAETGLAESTARYHLRVLENENLLEGAKVRGRRRYVPCSDADVELVAAFEEEATKEVLEALFEHEPATGTTLADALERDPSTVSHHLSRLSDAGLVDREQDGPALRNSLAPAVRSAFADVEVVSSVQQHARADD